MLAVCPIEFFHLGGLPFLRGIVLRFSLTSLSSTYDTYVSKSAPFTFTSLVVKLLIFGLYGAFLNYNFFVVEKGPLEGFHRPGIRPFHQYSTTFKNNKFIDEKPKLSTSHNVNKVCRNLKFGSNQCRECSCLKTIDTTYYSWSCV